MPPHPHMSPPPSSHRDIQRDRFLKDEADVKTGISICCPPRMHGIDCDVFLGKRTASSMLEYYNGILFMTSNREDAIDPAFGSRVHVTLHYPDLNAEAKRHIWEHFIAQSEPGNTFDEVSYTAPFRVTTKR
ncbi:hypothetical protein GGS20DRAFT_586473 [Poronia punctata]|nr:hypothetical protein GGS20DRAFT_586473 [Poronia punctata]